MRGATTVRREPPCRVQISIHAPRAGSDCKEARRDRDTHISIHAPRAGSDSQVAKSLQSREYFNPRSPCGERRALAQMSDVTDRFQSTLPVRGATMPKGWLVPVPLIFQSTLPVRGATLQRRFAAMRKQFQSTLPVRGATATILIPVGTEEFQSTLPVRGATVSMGDAMSVELFQSTLPVRGATSTRCRSTSKACGFQSTLPVRGATTMVITRQPPAVISIHAPRAGSDRHKRRTAWI